MPESCRSPRRVYRVRRARADLRLAFAQLVSAQARERELIAARDRLRGLADVLGKRDAAGDAAGFDRLRAEREVTDLDAGRAAVATERARAQVSQLPSSRVTILAPAARYSNRKASIGSRPAARLAG